MGLYFHTESDPNRDGLEASMDNGIIILRELGFEIPKSSWSHVYEPKTVLNRIRSRLAKNVTFNEHHEKALPRGEPWLERQLAALLVVCHEAVERGEKIRVG